MTLNFNVKLQTRVVLCTDTEFQLQRLRIVQNDGYLSCACAPTRPHLHAVTHLPARGTVAVSFVLEVGHALDHPVVDLRERQPLLG